MTFSRRHIDLEFRLGEGAFGDGGHNTVKVSGLRVSANISKAGGVSMTSLQLRVYGLPLSVMNQLSTLGKPLVAGRKNTITVEAGSDDTGQSVCFIGTIFQAWADLTSSPDGVFLVEAHTGLLDALRPLPPTSINGSADAATVISGLAQQMGYTFENSGVSVQLSYPYFSGTGRDQAYACAQAANIDILIDGTTLAIWPKTGSRKGASVLLSKDTGLVGYPTWTANGLVLTSLFNPNITFGGNVEIKSIITPACGTWTVFKVDHDLESEVPGGKWFTRLEATVLGHTAVAN